MTASVSFRQCQTTKIEETVAETKCKLEKNKVAVPMMPNACIGTTAVRRKQHLSSSVHQ
jgi:hypothetical protein